MGKEEEWYGVLCKGPVLNSNKYKRLRGGEPLRGHCAANPTLKLLTSGMTELHTHTHSRPTLGLKHFH